MPAHGGGPSPPCFWERLGRASFSSVEDHCWSVLTRDGGILALLLFCTSAPRNRSQHGQKHTNQKIFGDSAAPLLSVTSASHVLPKQHGNTSGRGGKEEEGGELFWIASGWPATITAELLQGQIFRAKALWESPSLVKACQSLKSKFFLGYTSPFPSQSGQQSNPKNFSKLWVASYVPCLLWLMDCLSCSLSYGSLFRPWQRCNVCLIQLLYILCVRFHHSNDSWYGSIKSQMYICIRHVFLNFYHIF